MKRVCPKCSYSAICISSGFDTIFNACALQFAKQWLETPTLTKSKTRIQRSAQMVLRAVQEVLPIGCPEMQEGTLRTVLLGVPPNGGPAVDVLVGSPY